MWSKGQRTILKSVAWPPKNVKRLISCQDSAVLGTHVITFWVTLTQILKRQMSTFGAQNCLLSQTNWFLVYSDLIDGEAEILF